jgi:hypothetical protein
MRSMKILTRLAAFAAVALAAATFVHAQSPEPEVAPYSSAPGAFTEAELDQMLAPIALYPDELLSQMLMAATYPLEVVEAARWSRAHRELAGYEAVAAVDNQDWDPSVKSMVAFPAVLAAMNEQLDWTQRLGEAFLGQQADVMRSVQKLRRAAYEAGNLASTDEMVVTREGTDFALGSPSPELMYVPYYDSRVVYGPWWWPAAPPVYWSPWPEYYVYSGYGFAWGLGIPIGLNFFYGDFDWGRHHVRVGDHRPFYYHGRDHRPIPTQGRQWQHDPAHRHGVEYRNPVARRDFGSARAPTTPRHDGRAGPSRPAPSAGGRPIARPAPQPGFFPQQPQARPAAPPQRGTESSRGGTGSPAARPYAPNAPQIARPQGNVPQAARPPVSAPPAGGQPIARPYAATPQGAHPQGGFPQGGRPPAAAPQQAQPIARPPAAAPQAARPAPSAPAHAQGTERQAPQEPGR